MTDIDELLAWIIQAIIASLGASAVIFLLLVPFIIISWIAEWEQKRIDRKRREFIRRRMEVLRRTE